MVMNQLHVISVLIMVLYNCILKGCKDLVKYLKVYIKLVVCNSYITGARDVWHLLHRSTRALAPEG